MIDQVELYREHQKRVEKYALALNSIYDEVITEIARLCPSGKFEATGEIFSFSKYPSIEKKIDEVLKKMHTDLLFLVSTSIKDEWDYSTRKNDALVKAVFGNKSFQDTRYKRFYNRNNKAKTAFLKRKVNGLGLSERIWRYVQGFKEEIELCIDDSLADGRSAAQLSRDVRKHLQEPNRLFRRVESRYGKKLVLSKKARLFNPGTGSYRSSYKNAMRMARTEINMAYRTADFMRWQQLDFIVGFEVRRSNNEYNCPVCASLAGRYPKDFRFVGWHPQCRCYVVAILCSQKELEAMNRVLLAGESLSSFKSRSQILKVPKGFTEWIRDNADRIKASKTSPYFISDNKKYIKI